MKSDRLWAVVNNAGIIVLSEAELCPIDKYVRLLDVNTVGVNRVTKTFLPLLRKQQGNRIVTVTSTSGNLTAPSAVVQCTAVVKCQVLAPELGT